LSKELFGELRDKSKSSVYGFCEELWKSGYIEESFIACNWSLAVRKNSDPSDIVIFEKWIDKYVNNWASCDTLCNHTVGELIEKYPELIVNLKRWAHSGNRWMRRAAAVSLIVPARKGKFLDDIFAIAEILLEDGDDMVRKGYGWMLKAASEAYQKEVYDFVVKHHEKMPRTAFRYAIEKLPDEMRARAMSL
jgi:3-methyladenine DNA glycosylase AlkD